MLITEGLNAAQAKAVETLSGPVCVLAGAGSGKTKTLTHRIANLLLHGVKPSRILAVTFTNKAAGEMRSRLWKLTADPASFEDPDMEPPRSFMPYMGTFHGICVKILREEHEAVGLPRSFTIYDVDEQVSLVRQVIKRLKLEVKPKSKDIQNLISYFKNEGEGQSRLNSQVWADPKQAAKIYHEYEKEKAEVGAVDFDDLLLKVYELFRTHKDIKEKWRSRFDHILIDEYQDTSKIQYKIIRQLVNTERNICVVGDDWQSIYSWRGADFTNILNFEKDFPGATIIRLEENYRSTGNILAAAEKLIRYNKDRTEKRIFTNYGDGAPVVIKTLRDTVAESNFVGHRILELMSEDPERRFSDFAILYRVNSKSSNIEHAFMSLKIPYNIVGGLRFYERAEIKDVIALLRLLGNRKDFIALHRITKNVLGGIGDVTYTRIEEYLRGGGKLGDAALSSVLRARARDAVQNLAQWLEEAAQLERPVDMIKSAIDHYDLVGKASSDPDRGEEKTANLRELTGTADSYDDLGEFLADVALLSSADEVDNSNCVHLMTVHAAKGLEYPVVFMIGMDDGSFPSARAIDEGGLEEERRLAYVGMTRACRHLYLTYARRQRVFGGWSSAPMSRFLAELGYDPDDPDSYADYFGGEDEDGDDDSFFFSGGYDPFPPDLPIFE